MLEQDRDRDRDPHRNLDLAVVCLPHKQLPVEVWLGSILLAQLPSRESLGDLNRHYVLQRLRHRLLLEMQRPDAAASAADA